MIVFSVSGLYKQTAKESVYPSDKTSNMLGVQPVI